MNNHLPVPPELQSLIEKRDHKERRSGADRRQKSIPVAEEKRSGKERRSRKPRRSK